MIHVNSLDHLYTMMLRGHKIYKKHLYNAITNFYIEMQWIKTRQNEIELDRIFNVKTRSSYGKDM